MKDLQLIKIEKFLKLMNIVTLLGLESYLVESAEKKNTGQGNTLLVEHTLRHPHAYQMVA